MKRSTVCLTLLISLTLLIALASASAQLAPTREAPQNEALEKYDDSPAPPRKIETSPRMISRFGLFISYQVNVDANGQNIIGDAANECSISVDPTDGNKMTIAWRQFNDVNSNFRQGGWGYTTDGGINWTFPGVLENNVFRSDPVTNSDEIGHFFYLSLQSDVNQSFFCDDLWRSTNGGQSWSLLSGERGAGGGDKQWLTIDKTGGPGHGFQYQSTDQATCSGTGIFQRSTDGGVTWQPPIDIPNEPIFGTLDVDTNGNLYVGGEGNTFYCVRSSNAQIGGQTPTFDQVTPVNMGGDLGFSSTVDDDTCFLQAIRQRLVHEHVLALLHCGHGDCCVEMIGRHDFHRVQIFFFRQQFAKISINRAPFKFFSAPLVRIRGFDDLFCYLAATRDAGCSAPPV